MTAPNRRPLPLVEILIAAVVVSGVLLADWQWKVIFADWDFVVPTTISSMLAAGVAVLAHRAGWGRPASFLAALAATTVTLLGVYRADAIDLPGDLISSWKALASTGLLIPTDPRFVLVPVVVAALGCWAATDWLMRRGSAAPSLLALVAVHAVAIAYSVSQQRPPIWSIVALMALGAALLAIAGLSRPGGAEFSDGSGSLSGRQSLGTNLLGPAAMVLALTLVCGGLAFVLDRGESTPFDLRDRLARPLDITETATPLARVKAGLVDSGNETVFTIRLDGLIAGQEIEVLPVAVLDRYDGAIWSTGATFEPAGSQLPRPTESVPLGPLVQQRITLTDEYPFRFLPRAGTVRTVVGDNLAWDSRTGSLATIDRTQREYNSAVALVASFDADEPNAISPIDNTIFAAGSSTTQKADLSDDQRQALSAYLSEVTSAGDEPLVQMQQLEADLAAADFGYNIEAPAGHSLAALVSYLAPSATEQGPGAPAARVGFAEHAAASFAVLARELDVPSRVVVGYRLEAPITVEAPEALVSNNQIHAWPEVWLADRGWVRFEPTNPANQTNDQATRTPSVSSAGVDADRTDLPDLEDPILLADDPISSERSSLWWLGVLMALPFIYVLGVTIAKAGRRSRRRAKTADNRIVGAWRETQDRFSELGLPASPSLSAVDVVDELDLIDLREVGDSVSALVPAIDTALYSPHGASDTQADTAWVSANQAIKLARQSTSVGTRAKARLDPRPLLRRNNAKRLD